MSDEGMSDAEFDAKVGFPVGERYVPKSKLDAAERERDALREALVGYLNWGLYPNTNDQGPVRAHARAALTANHSAPVVEE